MGHRCGPTHWPVVGSTPKPEAEDLSVTLGGFDRGSGRVGASLLIGPGKWWGMNVLPGSVKDSTVDVTGLGYRSREHCDPHDAERTERVEHPAPLGERPRDDGAGPVVPPVPAGVPEPAQRDDPDADVPSRR